MPIYEYICEDCEAKFEKLVLSSKTEITCPKCQSARCEQVYSAFAFSSGGKFTPSVGADACSTCSASSCATCHR